MGSFVGSFIMFFPGVIVISYSYSLGASERSYLALCGILASELPVA